MTSESLAFSHIRKFHTYDMSVCRVELLTLIMEPGYETTHSICGVAEGVKPELS